MDLEIVDNSKNGISKYQFIHHFLPHPTHKRRATLLSPKAFVLYCVFLVFFFLVYKSIPVALPGVLGYASNINTTDLLNETNITRANFGKAPLKINNQLSKAAEKKAKHMFLEDYWAHISPSGVKPWDFILSEGYDYEYAGENLAKNFNSSDQVVRAWYNSESHRENLLSSNYEEIGFAVVNGVLDGYETTLVVQMFGTSRDSLNLVDSVSVNGVNESAELETVNVANDEEIIINEVDTEGNFNIGANSTAGLLEVQGAQYVPLLNVDNLSRYILGLFLSFITILFALDVWYTKKKDIVKVNGHIFAHTLFLVVVLVSVWLVISPGRIL